MADTPAFEYAPPIDANRAGEAPPRKNRLAFARRLAALSARCALGAAALLAAPGLAAQPAPQANGGILDLRDTDLSREVVELRGQWRVYRDRFLDPKAELPQGGVPINVPGHWNKEGGAEGFGTYVLDVQCTSAPTQAIRFPAERSALRLFVNGREVAHQGTPGENAATAVPVKAGTLASLGTPTCPMRIVAHVSNFNHRQGGLVRAIELGAEPAVRVRQERAFAFGVTLFTGFLIMALLPLLFVLTRPRERPPLWFGLFCLSLALFNALAREGVVSLVFREPGWEAFLKVEYLSWYWGTVLFLLFMRSMYPAEVKAGPVKAFVACGVAVAAFVTLAPARVYSQALPLFQFVAVLTGLYITYAMAVAARNRRHGARVLLAALVVIVCAELVDFMQADEPLRTLALPFASLMFALAPAAVLIGRYGRALSREEVRLLEQRQRTEMLVRATKAGFLDWDAVAGVTTYSDRFKEMLGYAPETDSAVWGNYFSLVHPDDLPHLRTRFLAQLRDCSQPNAQRNMEPHDFRMIRADGSVIWVHAEAILQTGPDGKTVRHVCSFIDITEAKRQEAEMSDRVKFVDDLFESVPIALAMRDPEGIFRYVNRTWEKLIGYRREEVIGKSLFDLFPAERAESRLKLDQEAFARGPGSVLEGVDRMFEGKRLTQTRTVMADSQGRLLGVITASLDTSARFEAEQALLNQQRRLDLVVRAAQAGIVDWDGKTHATYYSPRLREIRGYAPDTDTSDWPDYFKVMIHPDDRERVTSRFRDYILGKGPGGPREYYEPEEYRLSRADGSYVWVQIMGVCERDDKGFATRFIAAVTDITERRAQEQALRESVRLREEVERIARHDLKTPLNSIVAAARLLREERAPTEGEAELLDVVERAGYRVLSMVNLSFDIFRMERGEYRFQPQAVDLSKLIERIAADLRIHAVSKGVGLRLPEAGQPIYAWADELLCYSIFANLLKNAIEASPDSTAVTVKLVENGGGIFLSIHNPGEVPAAVRAHFFEKYSTSGKSGGLGLGTYSARLLARVQEGDISMRTSAEAGTTLEIRLLALPYGLTPPAELQEGAGSAQAAPAALPPVSVLVVDDDEYNLLVMRRYLPPPLTVRTEANGRAALDALEGFAAEVVFMDLEMPVMDGYEAVKLIRERERATGRRPVAIVAFSSHDDEESKQRSLAAGCNLYLRKPAAREAVHRVLLELSGHAAPAENEGRPEALPAGPAEPVLVDADMRDTVPAFLRSRREAIDQLGEALRRGDQAQVRRIAHKLSGSFALYGFHWASDQCRAIEGGSVGASGLPHALDELLHHLSHVEIRYSDAEPVGDRHPKGEAG